MCGDSQAPSLPCPVPQTSESLCYPRLVFPGEDSPFTFTDFPKIPLKLRCFTLRPRVFVSLGIYSKEC